MFSGAVKRFLSLLLIVALFMSPISVSAMDAEVGAEETVQSIPFENNTLDTGTKGAGDPLQSVATVTTGGDVSTYVDINSAYVPGGYTTLSTGGNAYVSAPGTVYSYHTSRNGSTSNTYIPTPTNDLSWSTNSGNTGITGSLSDTAVSDYKGCGENGALSAKVNSKVLQIHALADINVTFSYTSSMTVKQKNGDGSIQEGVYTLKTSSASPTVSQLLAGTECSHVNLTENKPKEASSSGTVTESIEQGQYFYIYFYGFVNDYNSNSVDSTDYTYTASVTNFQITPVTQNYSLTVGNTDCTNSMVGGGKIAVKTSAGTTTVTVPASGFVTGLANQLSGTSVTLTVSQVPSGYFHIGWRAGSTTVFEKSYDLTLTSDMTVYALFIPQVTVTMGSSGYSDASYSYKNPSGTTVNGADQFVARNSAGTSYYYTLADAFSSNNVVVLLGNIVLNGAFTVPSGKTLSLQHDWNDAATAELQTAEGTATPTVFATATINGTVTLQGNLVASALQSTTDGQNGRAVGGIGHLIVNGTIHISSGGKLCTYGMVTGSGQINVASGGKVYELMEVRDMRSIYVMPTVVSGHAFPLNHFFIKTNEVRTTYSAGAELIGCYSISVNGKKAAGRISAIGTAANSMF